MKIRTKQITISEKYYQMLDKQAKKLEKKFMAKISFPKLTEILANKNGFKLRSIKIL